MQVPAQNGQYGVPCTSAYRGVEQEFPIVHLCQSGWNGDEVTDAGNESAGDGGHHTMVVKIFLAFLHLALAEHAEMAEFAVGKLIDDGTAEIVACQIVDGGSGHGTKSGEENHKPDVDVAGGGMVGSGSYNELAGYGNHGALEEHQNVNRRVVEI